MSKKSLTAPLVSIIIGTLNRSKVISRAIDSILNQDYKNIECVIVDCGSIDNTSDIVNSYSDNRIKYIQLDNDPGRENSLTLGIKKSRGEFISFLDDDDEYYKEKISSQIELFKKIDDDYGVVYCWSEWIDDKDNSLIRLSRLSYSGFILPVLLEKMVLNGFPTMLIRRDVFEKISYFKDNKIKYPSDWQLACRIARIYKFAVVKKALVRVYVNHVYERMSDPLKRDHSYWRRQCAFHEDFLKEFSKEYSNYSQKQIVHLLPIITLTRELGEWEKFIYYSKKAIRLKPFSIKVYKKFLKGLFVMIKSRWS